MKRLVFIGGGIESKPALKHSKSLGYENILIDKDVNCPSKEFCDYFIPSSVYDHQKAIILLRKLNIDFHGVLCVATDASITLAQICNEFSLNGPTISSAEVLTDKILMKEVFKKENLPIPNFQEVKSISDIKIFLSSHDKAVLKPSDNRGSRGVFILTSDLSESQLTDFYKESKSLSSSKKVIIEEFLEGDQLSTESIVNNSKAYTIGISDRNYSRLAEFYPRIIEDGGDLPSKYIYLKKEIDRLVQNVSDTLGLDYGVLKGDLVVHENEVKIIEFGLRHSGGYFCTHEIPLSTGVDFIGLSIKSSIGLQLSSAEVSPSLSRFISQRFFFMQPGKVSKVYFSDELIKKNCIEFLDIRINPGDTIDDTTSHVSRIGMVICSGTSRENAIKNADSAVKELKISYSK